MKKTHLILGILALGILASCKKQINETVADEEIISSRFTSESNQDSANHVPNQLLVRFKNGTTQTARANAFARISGRIQEHVITNGMRNSGDREGFYVVHTPLHALEALSKIKGGAELEYAELNYIYTHSYTSEDKYYTNGSLWGMYGDASPLKTNVFGSQAAEAWAAGNIGSAQIYIGVIDEGAMHTHKDLAGNIDTQYGWDFVNNDATPYDGASDDHGTHVAGTIGAKSDNSGEGVAGMVWNVNMISAKFLGPRGGTTANAIKALDYITNLKKYDVITKTYTGLNIIATNNSWGGGGYNKDLELAIGRAGDAEILFICAAGNDGKNIDKTGSHSFPACYYNWNIIAVAAITNTGALASYSNYGEVGLNNANGTDPNHSFVDIGAPGSGIWSTIPSRNGTGSSYASWNGTSMATPHVTGAAALYKAANPNATAADIKNAILNSATPTLPSLDKKCITSGRLNAGGFH